MELRFDDMCDTKEDGIQGEIEKPSDLLQHQPESIRLKIKRQSFMMMLYCNWTQKTLIVAVFNVPYILVLVELMI